MAADTRRRMIDSAAVLVARHGSRGTSFSEVLVVFTLDGSPRPRIMGRAAGATVEV